MRRCACGCGLELTDRRSTWRRGHHAKVRGIVQAQPALDARLRESVDAQVVAEALHRIRAQKGWSLREMAATSGLSYDHFMQIYYATHAKRVKKSTLERVLRRLAGGATTPTTYDRRRYARRLEAIR